jgi:hypothetical protein
VGEEAGKTTYGDGEVVEVGEDLGDLKACGGLGGKLW